MSNIDKLKQQLEEKLEQEYREFIEKITFKTKEEIIRNAYKLTNKYEDFEEENNEIIEENVDGIIDDLPKEYNEIACEKCGDCIYID